MKVAVIGGGIGGLSVALQLLHAGADVHVYEQAMRMGEIGAGVQISPNASRLLLRLGLKAAMDAIGTRPRAVEFRRWNDGSILQRAPLEPEVETAFGAPYYHFHRAQLVDVLANALPSERLHLGHKFMELEQNQEHVIARFENGVTASADLMVGADGIHSRVRSIVFGPERPRFTGCVAWRGLVPAERVEHLGTEIVSRGWLGPGGHVVHYWVSGGRMMNVVCIVEHGDWTREFWTDRGELADVLARYQDWHPTVRKLIGAFSETFIWALHDRAALPNWSVGRVTLLGDACHPMLPMMAQGAAQSIEDGAALAALLRATPDDIASVLVRYEALRKPRATKLQEASAANRTRFHLPDGDAQRSRDDAMATSSDRSIANIKWLYEHDAADVRQ
jgi:salicylate hydroxylase